MKNENRMDATALRKLREVRGLSRKEAGTILGLGYKAVERFENGRAILGRTRIEQTARVYGLTYEDFLLCREGKGKQVKEKFCHKKEKVIENNKARRSYKKIITKEVKVLKVLRKLKNLSQYKASFICGYHKGAIGHIENGRIELHEARIAHIVKCYGFSLEDFERHMKADVLVTEIQDQCISIIRGLTEDKLKVVHPLLLNFK